MDYFIIKYKDWAGQLNGEKNMCDNRNKGGIRAIKTFDDKIKK